MSRILIADDSLDDAVLLELLIHQMGRMSTHVLSGREALKKLSEEKFDLIISDYQMDDGDGLWLLENIQNGINHPPFILVSADPSMNLERAQAVGTCSFLEKPINLDQLKSMISALLNREEVSG